VNRKGSRPVLQGGGSWQQLSPTHLVFCESKEDAEKVIGELTSWLAIRGLTLSPEKTRIVHLEEGFDFLGYHVRHYKDVRTRTGWKLLITPSKDAVKRVREKLKAKWLSLKAAPTAGTCSQLNRIVRGWANYHRVVVSTRTFQGLDHWMFQRAFRWAKFRHAKKSAAWRKQRYWGSLNPERDDTWVFGDKRTGIYLLKFTWFSRRHHILVKGTSSPDDPTLRAYWHQRRTANAAELNAKGRRLAKRQGYRCDVCQDTLFNGEVLELHHMLPREDPRRKEETYQRLVHLMCHQQLTKVERQGARAAHQPVLDHEEIGCEGLSVSA
jgi:RNA-directed DNA polymerase